MNELQIYNTVSTVLARVLSDSVFFRAESAHSVMNYIDTNAKVLPLTNTHTAPQHVFEGILSAPTFGAHNVGLCYKIIYRSICMRIKEDGRV